MSTTILCHSRGPSRMATLAGAASSAAVVLEFWRHKQKDPPNEVLRLLELLVLPENKSTRNSALVATLTVAFHTWDGRHVRSIDGSLGIIRKRLQKAATKGAKVRSKEAASLRRFCLALSTAALVRAR